MLRARVFHEADIEIMDRAQAAQRPDVSRETRESALAKIALGPAWTIEDAGRAVAIGGFQIEGRVAIGWALVADGVTGAQKRLAFRHCLRAMGRLRLIGIQKIAALCHDDDAMGRGFLPRLGFELHECGDRMVWVRNA